MKYKLFEEYNEQQNDGHPGFLQSEEEIHAWAKEYDRNYDNNYVNNTYKINKDDWTVNVKGDVDISDKELDYIEVKYNEVDGYFDCWNNDLFTLEGSPRKVEGYFNCGSNELITLQYAPIDVYGDFDCWNNDLITIKYNWNRVANFYHDKLQGSLNERWNRYRNYIETLDEEEKVKSLKWLYDVDEDFRELVVKYAVYNNIDINTPGANKDIAKDALKHNDSGLF